MEKGRKRVKGGKKRCKNKRKRGGKICYCLLSLSAGEQYWRNERMVLPLKYSHITKSITTKAILSLFLFRLWSAIVFLPPPSKPSRILFIFPLRHPSLFHPFPHPLTLHLFHCFQYFLPSFN